MDIELDCSVDNKKFQITLKGKTALHQEEIISYIWKKVFLKNQLFSMNHKPKFLQTIKKTISIEPDGNVTLYIKCAGDSGLKKVLEFFNTYFYVSSEEINSCRSFGSNLLHFIIDPNELCPSSSPAPQKTFEKEGSKKPRISEVNQGSKDSVALKPARSIEHSSLEKPKENAEVKKKCELSQQSQGELVEDQQDGGRLISEPAEPILTAFKGSNKESSKKRKFVDQGVHYLIQENGFKTSPTSMGSRRG